MSNRTTVPLVIIAVILFVVERWLSAPVDSTAGESSTSRMIDFGSVNAIFVEKPDGEIRLRKDNSGIWTITSDEGRDANQNRVHSLLDVVENLANPATIVSQVEDPREMGLEPSNARVILENSGAERLVVNVGNADSESDFVYTSLNTESFARRAAGTLWELVVSPSTH